MARIAELSYQADSTARFAALRSEPWPVFLDSASAPLGQGRFDVLAADPTCTVTTRGRMTEIRSRSGVERSEADPLELLQAALGERVPRVPGVPFAGGAIGYLSYDLGRRFEKFDAVAAADIDLPELGVGIYDWAVVVDHVEARAWLVGQGRDARTAARWDELIARLEKSTQPVSPPFEMLSPVAARLTRSEYDAAFATIKAHIAAGDCYQVNLTQRYQAAARGDAWSAYAQLRRANPAPYSAFLDLPFGAVLSSSPERFLSLRDGHVTTEPIKGTRRRSADGRGDRACIEELRASSKDRAENVMIVDLLRNDLGKTCIPGTIRPTRLYAVESFASVHHLVSTVEGELDPSRHAVDLLRGCFPGGSITGAPKLRAMQIIEQLEPERRSVYCGAIGYIGFDGDMDTNIAIRTLLHTGEMIYAWAGGGVVADSDASAEYRECLDKASALLDILNRETAEAAS